MILYKYGYTKKEALLRVILKRLTLWRPHPVSLVSRRGTEGSMDTVKLHRLSCVQAGYYTVYVI